FEYSVNDTGMEPSPFGLFTAVPPVQANRTARFRIIVDTYHLCMREAQLPLELHSRGIHFRRFRQNGADVYVMRGKNEIRVSTTVFNGCVDDIDISQITAVEHPVGPAVILPGNSVP
ncbi:MAG TPA: hypothetical protein VGD54_09635, partial [Steroidobacteraceae bacterium]